MVQIRTQDGYIEEFDKEKIIESITKDVEFLVHNNPDKLIGEEDVKKIAAKVKRLVDKMEFSEDEVLSSDTIRGLVVTELYKSGLIELANITEIVGLRPIELDGIIHGSDDSENANLQASPETSHKKIADRISQKYLERMLPEHLSKAHSSGDLHIHDSEYFFTRPFCRSWDLRPFFFYGFSPDGNNNAITAGPPKHAEVAILQATKVLAMGQTQHAGGQGLLHGLVFLSPYMSGKSYGEIYQLMQMMLYELNQMYISRGGQVIFSSINISPGVPKILENVRAVAFGKILDRTYGKYEREVRLMFRALMELSLRGDYTGKLFPFPKLEVAIEEKFINSDTWKTPLDLNSFGYTADSYYDLYRLAFQVVAKYGTLYFDNMLSEKKSDSSMSCTQCCAYSFSDSSEIDPNFDKKLNFQDGYHFRLGGMQVISLNLPRIAYKAQGDEKKLISGIYYLMDKSVEIFKIKKESVEKNKNRLKFITQIPQKDGVSGQSFVDFDELVYEIGIVGLNEMVQYHTSSQLHESEEAVHLGERILGQMRDYCRLLSEFHNMKVVLARTPAETVAQKFAVCDLIEYSKTIGLFNLSDIIKGDISEAILKIDETKNLPIYYSNGFAPSVDADISIFERLQIEDRFWKLVDGGAITHVWLGESEPDPDGLMDFAMRVFKTTSIGYLAFTKDMSQCMHCHHITSGLVNTCGVCDRKDLIWHSRITGYYSPVGEVHDGKMTSRWNEAKMEELKHRKKVDIK